MKHNQVNPQPFQNQVYEVVAQIPAGRVISYGEIALLLGKPRYSRMVGRALKQVPAHLSLPCHRVVNAQGRLAPGWPEQKELLTEEGVKFRQNGEVNMKLYRWNWQEIRF